MVYDLGKSENTCFLEFRIISVRATFFKYYASAILIRTQAAQAG